MSKKTIGRSAFFTLLITLLISSGTQAQFATFQEQLGALSIGKSGRSTVSHPINSAEQYRQELTILSDSLTKPHLAKLPRLQRLFASYLQLKEWRTKSSVSVDSMFAKVITANSGNTRVLSRVIKLYSKKFAINWSDRLLSRMIHEYVKSDPYGNLGFLSEILLKPESRNVARQFERVYGDLKISEIKGSDNKFDYYIVGVLMGQGRKANEIIRRLETITNDEEVIFAYYEKLASTRNESLFNYMASVANSRKLNCYNDLNDEPMRCAVLIYQQLAPYLANFPFEVDRTGEFVGVDSQGDLDTIEQWFKSQGGKLSFK